jgi:hypothetical protein
MKIEMLCNPPRRPATPIPDAAPDGAPAPLTPAPASAPRIRQFHSNALKFPPLQPVFPGAGTAFHGEAFGWPAFLHMPPMPTALAAPTGNTAGKRKLEAGEPGASKRQRMDDKPPRWLPGPASDATIPGPGALPAAVPEMAGLNGNAGACLAVPTRRGIVEVRTLNDARRLFKFETKRNRLEAAIECIDILKDLAHAIDLPACPLEAGEIHNAIASGLNVVIRNKIYFDKRKDKEKAGQLKAHALAVAAREPAFCKALNIGLELLPPYRAQKLGINTGLKELRDLQARKPVQKQPLYGIASAFARTATGL